MLAEGAVVQKSISECRTYGAPIRFGRVSQRLRVGLDSVAPLALGLGVTHFPYI
jgi:hypothetical protein